MRLLGTGSRDWPDWFVVFRVMDRAYQEAKAKGERLTVVHGGCETGADAMISVWVRIAQDMGLDVVEKVFAADWSRGRRGGPERNKRMVTAGADRAVAFVLVGASTGTLGTIDLLREAGIHVDVYTHSFERVAA